MTEIVGTSKADLDDLCAVWGTFFIEYICGMDCPGFRCSPCCKSAKRTRTEVLQEDQTRYLWCMWRIEIRWLRSMLSIIIRFHFLNWVPWCHWWTTCCRLQAVTMQKCAYLTTFDDGHWEAFRGTGLGSQTIVIRTIVQTQLFYPCVAAA